MKHVLSLIGFVPVAMVAISVARSADRAEAGHLANLVFIGGILGWIAWVSFSLIYLIQHQ